MTVLCDNDHVNSLASRIWQSSGRQKAFPTLAPTVAWLANEMNNNSDAVNNGPARVSIAVRNVSVRFGWWAGSAGHCNDCRRSVESLELTMRPMKSNRTRWANICPHLDTHARARGNRPIPVTGRFPKSRERHCSRISLPAERSGITESFICIRQVLANMHQIRHAFLLTHA